MTATYAQVGVPQDNPNGGPSRSARSPPTHPTPTASPSGWSRATTASAAAYDVFGSTRNGVAGASAQTARRPSGLTHDESFFLLLNGDTIGEISGLWDKLADGATVIAPLVTAQPAAPPYGMLTDRFGITWIFGATPAH